MDFVPYPSRRVEEIPSLQAAITDAAQGQDTAARASTGQSKPPNEAFATSGAPPNGIEPGALYGPGSSTGQSQGIHPLTNDHGVEVRHAQVGHAQPWHRAISMIPSAPKDDNHAQLPSPPMETPPAGHNERENARGVTTSHAGFANGPPGPDVVPNGGVLRLNAPVLPESDPENVPTLDFGRADLNPGTTEAVKLLRLDEAPVPEKAWCYELVPPFPIAYYNLCKTPCACWPVVVRAQDNVLGLLVQGVLMPVGKSDNPILARWHHDKWEWRLQFQSSSICSFDLNLKHHRRQMRALELRGDRILKQDWQESWITNLTGAWNARATELELIKCHLNALVRDQSASTVPGIAHNFSLSGNLLTFSTPAGIASPNGVLNPTEPASMTTSNLGSGQPPADFAVQPADLAGINGTLDQPQIDPALLHHQAHTTADGTIRPYQMHIAQDQQPQMTTHQERVYHSLEHHHALVDAQRRQEWPHLAEPEFDRHAHGLDDLVDDFYDEAPVEAPVQAPLVSPLGSPGPWIGPDPFDIDDDLW